ncbi:MAG: hypothetical protein RMZ69_03750 [Nostoc sp. ChiQUE01a]|nr:hypothetical protein [Nostoc sp. ChiQUE01a]
MTTSNNKINKFDLELNNIFLPEFTFIDLPDAIPGGILPHGGKEIWENNQIIHQCSLKFSERDLFSNFLELNPKFLEQRLEIKQSDWQRLE